MTGSYFGNPPYKALSSFFTKSFMRDVIVGQYTYVESLHKL